MRTYSTFFRPNNEPLNYALLAYKTLSPYDFPFFPLFISMAFIIVDRDKLNFLDGLLVLFSASVGIESTTFLTVS